MKKVRFYNMILQLFIYAYIIARNSVCISKFSVKVSSCYDFHCTFKYKLLLFINAYKIATIECISKFTVKIFKC